MAPRRSLSHLLPAHPNTHTQQTHERVLSDRDVSARGVLLYLIVSKCVESFPVVVDLSCDVFVLQDDSGHPTLAPLFGKKEEGLGQSTQVSVLFSLQNVLQ